MQNKPHQWCISPSNDTKIKEDCIDHHYPLRWCNQAHLCVLQLSPHPDHGKWQFFQTPIRKRLQSEFQLPEHIVPKYWLHKNVTSNNNHSEGFFYLCKCSREMRTKLQLFEEGNNIWIVWIICSWSMHSIQGHKGDSSTFLSTQIADDFGWYLIILNHHMKQAATLEKGQENMTFYRCVIEILLLLQMCYRKFTLITEV